MLICLSTEITGAFNLVGSVALTIIVLPLEEPYSLTSSAV